MKYSKGDFLRITDLEKCGSASNVNATHVLIRKAGLVYSYYSYDTYKDGKEVGCCSGCLKDEHLEPLDRITSASQLTHGMRVVAQIEGEWIYDAKISVKDGRYYVCQNSKDGNFVADRLGYEYSWWIDEKELDQMEFDELYAWDKLPEDNLETVEYNNFSLNDTGNAIITKTGFTKTPHTHWQHYESYRKDGVTFDRDTVKLPYEELTIQELRDRLNLYRSIVRKYDSVFPSNNS